MATQKSSGATSESDDLRAPNFEDGRLAIRLFSRAALSVFWIDVALFAAVVVVQVIR